MKEERLNNVVKTDYFVFNVNTVTIERLNQKLSLVSNLQAG